MTLNLSSALLSLLVFVQAFSFSAHNLKGYVPAKSSAAMGVFALVATGMLALGKFLGLLFAESLPELSAKAGAALIMVLAAKLFLRGWKTKPLQRVFDMSRIGTAIGLAFAANIDLLLLAIASSIIAETSWMIALTIPISAGISGLISGLVYARKAPITLPNLLDIVMAVSLMLAGVYLWIA